MIISTIIIVVIIPHHPIKHFRLAFLYISFEQCHIHTDVRTNIHTDVSFPKIASICWTGTLNCIAACWELTNDGWLLNANHCVWYTHALHSSSSPSSSHLHLIFICIFTFIMLSIIGCFNHYPSTTFTFLTLYILSLWKSCSILLERWSIRLTLTKLEPFGGWQWRTEDNKDDDDDDDDGYNNATTGTSQHFVLPQSKSKSEAKW